MPHFKVTLTAFHIICAKIIREPSEMVMKLDFTKNAFSSVLNCNTLQME